MKPWKIKIEPDAFDDIMQAADWYNREQANLGNRFKKTVINQINSLVKNPRIYAIRYKEIRCLPIRKFPYMAHYYVNNENYSIEILAVISTSRNPKIWEDRTSKTEN